MLTLTKAGDLLIFAPFSCPLILAPSASLGQLRAHVSFLLYATLSHKEAELLNYHHYSPSPTEGSNQPAGGIATQKLHQWKCVI